MHLDAEFSHTAPLLALRRHVNNELDLTPFFATSTQTSYTYDTSQHQPLSPFVLRRHAVWHFRYAVAQVNSGGAQC